MEAANQAEDTALSPSAGTAVDPMSSSYLQMLLSTLEGVQVYLLEQHAVASHALCHSFV